MNGELLFFRQREGIFYPTLRLLHKCKFPEEGGGGSRGGSVGIKQTSVQLSIYVVHMHVTDLKDAFCISSCTCIAVSGISVACFLQNKCNSLC